MPQPYSADLRERVLVAYEQGEGSQVAIARHFRVCPASVCTWLRQARDDGRRCPKPHRGGPAGRLGDHEVALLRQLVAETNDARLDQYAERLFASTGKRVSRPVMCRTLHRLKLRPKKTLRAAEQDRPEIAAEREAYRPSVTEMPAERLVFLDLVFLDESGVTTKMARTRARALRGSAPMDRCRSARGSG